MKKKKTSNADEILLYKEKGGQTAVEVRFQGETAWLALNQIADLFQRDKSVISRHLRNIFEAGELLKNRVVAKNATTAADGKIYQVEYYNLDAIISVGYRVNSKRGTQFRSAENGVIHSQAFWVRSNRHLGASRFIKVLKRKLLICFTSSSQGPSFLRWQQAHRIAAFHTIPCEEPLAVPDEW